MRNRITAESGASIELRASNFVLTVYVDDAECGPEAARSVRLGWPAALDLWRMLRDELRAQRAREAAWHPNVRQLAE